MTLPRKQADYGGLKMDARPFSNPQTDARSADWNRLCADSAAMTTPAPTKLRALFSTTTSNGVVSPTWFAAQWGLDSLSAPVITRTSTGVYTVQTPAAWTTPGIWVYSLDPNGVTSISEQVAFAWSKGDIDVPVATADGKVRSSRSGYTITVYVTNTSSALSDLGGGVPIYIEAG